MATYKKYWFRKTSEDGIVWEFQKRFPNAFAADRWAYRQFEKWFSGQISYRIVFLA